jgi:hypothetical protein
LNLVFLYFTLNNSRRQTNKWIWRNREFTGQFVAVAALQSVRVLWPVVAGTRALALKLSDRAVLWVWLLEDVKVRKVIGNSKI